jgi:hypothetical protein
LEVAVDWSLSGRYEVQPSERGAQLVRSVRRKESLFLERSIQAGQHLVECVRELA